MSTVGQQGTGFAPTGLGGGTPLFPQPNGRMAGRQPPTAQQLLAGGSLPGGAQIPGQFATPVGPVENTFGRVAAGGVPLASSVAAGQIPPGILQQFKELQAQQNAQILERMPGARFGSDIAGVLARSGGQNLTNLLADTERNAVGTEMGFANPLLSSELARTGGAQNLAFQNYLQSRELPPALSLLLSLAGLGGGSASGRAQGTQYGVNLLGSI